MPGTRSHLRMEPTGVGTFLIHRAAPGHSIQIQAIPAGTPGQRIDAVFEIEMLNQPRLGQPLGNLFGGFMLRLERVYQAQPNQIGQFHFDGHGAAIGGTAIAQATAVLGPGVRPIDIDNGKGRLQTPPSVHGRRPRAIDIPTQDTHDLDRVDARRHINVNGMRRCVEL